MWRNYKPKNGGETDIIYRDGKELVFCEVKTRTLKHYAKDYGAPSRAVDHEKKKRLRRAAKSWLKGTKGHIVTRFDIIEVILAEGEPPKVNRLKNAFV